MFLYEAFGITIASEISLPELRVSTKLATVTLKNGSVPEKLATATVVGARYELAPKQFLLTVDGVARFLVEDGSKILVDRMPTAQDDDIRSFLLSVVFGVLVLQRDTLALQASVVEFGDHCIAFSGRDGAGKAILAEEFRIHGHRILSDDIAAIEFDEFGSPYVQPAYPIIRLWEDILVELGDDFSQYPRIRAGIRKYAKPITQDFCDESRPLTAIYLLVRTNTPAIRIETVSALEKIYLINNDTFGHQFIEGMGLVPRESSNALKLIGHTRLKVIIRPGHRMSITELLDRISEDIEHG